MAPDLDDLVDDWLTVPDLADRLGLAAGQVRRLLQDRALIGTRHGSPPVFAVPADFLVPAHLANPANAEPVREGWAVLASLRGTLTVLADAGFEDAEAIAWLFGADGQLGTSPLEALRAGRKTEVRRRAALEL